MHYLNLARNRRGLQKFLILLLRVVFTDRSFWGRSQTKELIQAYSGANNFFWIAKAFANITRTFLNVFWIYLGNLTYGAALLFRTVSSSDPKVLFQSLNACCQKSLTKCLIVLIYKIGYNLVICSWSLAVYCIFG